MALQVGDVVWIKSGGRAMTVLEVKKDTVVLQWDAGASLQGSELPIAAVTTENPAAILAGKDAATAAAAQAEALKG